MDLDLNVCRFDTLKFDEIKLKETKEGYLVGNAIATRTGVFQYRKADGSIQRELRLPEDVFSQDTIDSFKLLPITDNHPAEFVNADNAKALSVGITGEDVKVKDSYLVTSLKITDAAAVNTSKGGKRGLSYGYTVNLVKEDGVYKGEKYDYIQKNIRGNHLAIVYQGRAGEEARLRLDSQDAECVITNSTNFTMKTLKLDGKEFEVQEEVASKLDSLEAENISLNTNTKELQSKLDALEGEKDAIQSKLDEELKKDHSALIAEQVKNRIALEKKAFEILKEDVSSLSDFEIKTKVINSFAPDFKADGKSEEYLNARFDASIDFRKDMNLAENMKLGASKGSEKIDLSNKALARNLINSNK